MVYEKEYPNLNNKFIYMLKQIKHIISDQKEIIIFHKNK